MLSPVYHLQREIAAERARQAGWRTVCASSGEPPEKCPRGGELVAGPPGAHRELPIGDDEATLDRGVAAE